MWLTRLAPITHFPRDLVLRASEKLCCQHRACLGQSQESLASRFECWRDCGGDGALPRLGGEGVHPLLTSRLKRREGHLPGAQSGEGARKLARWQPTCGVDLQTKDAVYTLSAMTSGIRRNWIEALRKTVRPTSAPDVTKYVLGWTGDFGEALTIPPALHPEWVSSARLRALGLNFIFPILPVYIQVFN